MGVIVNHGWFGGEAFEPMLPVLDTSTFTYAFMDYRGYGRSRASKGEYTIVLSMIGPHRVRWKCVTPELESLP